MRRLPNLIALPLAAITIPAYAADYLTVAQAQQIFYAGAKAVDVSVTLTEQQKSQIREQSGLRQRFDKQEVWRMEDKGQLQGWVLVDNVIGKHEFITYALAVDPNGKIKGIEILSYRETHGGQIRLPAWRLNFVGKSKSAVFKLNKDIPNISGATLSCRNVTDGVKRLLTLIEVAQLS